MNDNIWQPHNLQNALVTLAPLSADDFERLYRLASDPLVWEQHPQKDRWKREIFQGFFDGAMACGSAFVIENAKTGDAIGSTRFYDADGESSVMIGYTFYGREYWGKGYNSSVKALMLEYAFRFVDKVYLHIGAENIRSQIATMRLGAVKVQELEKPMGGKNILHHEYLIRRPSETKF